MEESAVDYVVFFYGKCDRSLGSAYYRGGMLKNIVSSCRRLWFEKCQREFSLKNTARALGIDR